VRYEHEGRGLEVGDGAEPGGEELGQERWKRREKRSGIRLRRKKTAAERGNREVEKAGAKRWGVGLGGVGRERESSMTGRSGGWIRKRGEVIEREQGSGRACLGGSLTVKSEGQRVQRFR